MRITQLSTARTSSYAMDKTASARASLVFIFNCLRVFRLFGDKKVYTVYVVTGQEKKTLAMVHSLFKKQELIEYVMHEFTLTDSSRVDSVAMFRTPLALVKYFSASGEDGLVAVFRRSDSAVTEDLEAKYAVLVADYRDKEIHDLKTQALIDFMWGVWCGNFDDEIMELCCADMQVAQTIFLWHRYLRESTKEIGAKYRVFVERCTAGPIKTVTIPVGSSELDDHDKQDLKQVQNLLLELRRKTVTFVSMPAIGGSYGADFSKLQMENLGIDASWTQVQQEKRRRARVRPLGGPLPPKCVKARCDDEFERADRGGHGSYETRH